MFKQELQVNTITDEEVAQVVGTIEQCRQSLQDDWLYADFETRRAVGAAVGVPALATVGRSGHRGVADTGTTPDDVNLTRLLALHSADCDQ